jgi:hypothetical protein
MLAHALGLLPFKDVFWSTSHQPGNPYNRSVEEKPGLEAAISTLTAGPVSPGDGIGFMDRELILRSCNADGLLLKPSRPIAPVDRTFLARAFGAEHGPDGVVLTTYAHVAGLRFDILLGAVLNRTYPVMPRDLLPGAAPAQARVAFTHDWAVGGGNTPLVRMQRFDEAWPLSLGPCNRSDFQLGYVSPVLASGHVLLGELDKWVPVSPQRIITITAQANVTAVTVAGAPGEDLTLYFADGASIEAQEAPLAVRCTLPPSGTAVVVVTSSRGGDDARGLRGECRDQL